MNIKRPIHTTLSKENIHKLKEYGDGILNIGIERALEIAESKKIVLNLQIEI